ncbi:MAG: TIGR00730 family Rossman fold protein [Planctomycetaceae bacterium]|nr:TIGR00730 family Rossman fold protein [Planctomycetaceae bacterium]
MATQCLTNVCVFSGSSVGNRADYRTAAEAFGRTLASTRRRLIYGGGAIGLMGAMADAALAASGEVIGVIPSFLSLREIRHDGLTTLHVVPSMHARKALMAELSDAFVALPGGLGTFDELCEILTWSQLGLHAKPVGLLNVLGYFDPLVTQIERAVADGFCRPEHRELFVVEADADRLLERLTTHTLPTVRKWIPSEEQV